MATNGVSAVGMSNMSWSQNLANQLDAADGKQDGKIAASIWNSFMAGTGSSGNRIYNFITLTNAIRSLNYYNNRKDSGIVDWSKGLEMFANLKAKLNGKMQIPAKDETPPAAQTLPAKDENPPQAKELDPKYNVQNQDLAGQEVKQEDGTVLKYDKNGYIISVKDKDGNDTLTISRKDDGSVDHYWEYIYDENGNSIREINRNADGSTYFYTDNEYDENGNHTREIYRNADGSVDYYWDFEYDERGNNTRMIYRNKDGSVKSYSDYEYDENDNETRIIYRNADGSVNEYEDYEYDKDGNHKRTTYYDANGRVKK